MSELKGKEQKWIIIKWGIIFLAIMLLYALYQFFVKKSFEEQVSEFINPIMENAGFLTSGNVYLWKNINYYGQIIYIAGAILICITGIMVDFSLMHRRERYLQKIIEHEKITISEKAKEEKIFLENERKRMGEYMENISHQIKTPLTGTLLALDNLYDIEENEKKKGKIESCINQLNSIKEMLVVLLRLAQIDSGKIWIKRKREDLAILIQECIDRVKILLEEKQIFLEVSLADSCILSCDGFWIKEAVENVIKNAIDYTPKEGKICITLKQMEHKYDIQIHNSGNALRGEVKEHLFERFYKIDDRNSCKESFGIGLNLSAEIVKLHQGILRVLDTTETGTTFQFIFPKLIAKDNSESNLTIL